MHWCTCIFSRDRFIVFLIFSKGSQNPKYLNTTILELCCPVCWPLATYAYLHLNSLKFNKVKHSVPQPHISRAQEHHVASGCDIVQYKHGTWFPSLQKILLGSIARCWFSNVGTPQNPSGGCLKNRLLSPSSRNSDSVRVRVSDV